MKSRVELSGETFEEAVTVNQRGLIDKILARYSTELTLFRELLQNANDAKATQLEIRFTGTGFWNTVEQSQQNGPQQKEKSPQLSYTGLRICNNGMVFRDQDWARIKSIADGNPDETKVGFFGVGFYSVFSISEEPTVLSGDKALSFHWKKDALFVTHGKIPEVRLDDAEEDKTMFGMVKNGWTVFDLPIRKDPPYPKLPLPRKMIEFLSRCLTFTTTLESVKVYYDSKLALTVARKVTGEPEPLKIGAGVHLVDPRSMFSFSRAFMEPLLYIVQSFDRQEPLVTEMMRVQSEFSVQVDQDFAAAMFRVTKKNPPKKITLQLLFDITESFSGKKTTAADIFDTFSPASERGGFFFIGSGITQQTTGTKCHCQAPFMPTMERNAMDFSDVTLATWNRALLWVTGALERLSFEHRCGLAIATAEMAHKSQGSNISKLSDKNEAGVMGSAVDEISDTKKQDEQTRMLVHRNMATFAMKPTTPVEQVGEIVSVGFFSSMAQAPTVWTSKGPQAASKARIKDETGLHEIVKSSVALVEPPASHGKEMKEDSVAETISKQAKSAFGFFASLLGSGSTDSPGSAGGKTKSPAARDDLGSLCARFIEGLVERRYLRELDVRDLETELKSRPLGSEEELVSFLRWLVKREKTLQSVRSLQRRQRQEKEDDNIVCHCNWCGKALPVSAEALKKEQLRQQEEQARTAQGMLSRFASTFTGQMTFDAIRIPLKCSRCSHTTILDVEEVRNSALSNVVLSTSYTSQHLVTIARFKEVKLKSFTRFLRDQMLERIAKSCEKGMGGKIEVLFWAEAYTRTHVLPQAVSQAIKEEELLCLDESWLKPISWSDWVGTCNKVLSSKSPPLSLEDLALASNIIRIVAFARQRNEIIGEDSVFLLSAMSSMNCVPVSTKELMKPTATYLGTESTGGFSSLPVVALCEALEDGSFHLNNNTPKDSAIVDLLQVVGVKQHIDLAYVFEEFNKGSLGWNRQEIVNYIATLHSKLDSSEMNRLKRAQFLPGVEVREGKAYPTMKSFYGTDLHFPDRELAQLQIPIYFPILEEGLVFDKGSPQPVPAADVARVENVSEQTLLPQQIKRDFFDACGETSPSKSVEFLKALGVKTYPTLDVVLNRASTQGPSQLAALKYLVKNFDQYKSSYRPTREKFIPCTNGTLENPFKCFTNEKVLLLGKPLVDKACLSHKFASMLRIEENPSTTDIVQTLAKSPPTPDNAQAVFEYLASLLPVMDRRSLQDLRSLSFVPILLPKQGDQPSSSNPQFYYASPSAVFFSPDGGKGKYDGLFPYVNFGSDAANLFLRSVGVRTEPTVDELAAEISTKNNAEKHVSRVGFTNYLHILRLLAVDWNNISISTKRAMSKAKCLVGMSHMEQLTEQKEKNSASPRAISTSEQQVTKDKVEEVPSNEALVDEETDVEFSLQFARDVFIGDNEVYKRIFQPIIAPQESVLEGMYQDLGSRLLSQAVQVSTKPVRPFSITEKTKKLEKLVRKRVHLFLFKRKKTDFMSSIDSLLSTITTEGKHFVYEVKEIKRTVQLGPIEKSKSCSAYAMSSPQLALIITSEFSLFECAYELADVLLRKANLHDQLLWGTILQSSDQVLRDQGYPVKLNAVVPPPQPVAAPVEVTKSPAPQLQQLQQQNQQQKNAEEQRQSQVEVGSKSAPPPPPPEVLHSQPSSSAAEKEVKSSHPESQEATKPNEGSVAPGNNELFGGQDLMQKQMVDEMVQKMTKQGKKGKSFLQMFSSKVLGNSSKQQLQALAQQKMEELAKAQSLESPRNGNSAPQQNPVPAPTPSPSTTNAGQTPAAQKQTSQRNGAAQGPGEGSSLMVDRDMRKQEMLRGLQQCNKGGGESVIQSPASQQQMVSVMDDLHDHNLVKTAHRIGGLECFIERDRNGLVSDADAARIYEVWSAEANGFAQMLSGIATEVFGVDSSICHLYHDNGGPTAAFNRGGALYFNFAFFLAQLGSSRWRIQTSSQVVRGQPLFVLPKEAIIDWYGVFSHELAHNHIHAHDAAFANWMMFYMTGFLEHLNAYLDRTQAILAGRGI